jgi:hypothetical protein
MFEYSSYVLVKEHIDEMRRDAAAARLARAARQARAERVNRSRRAGWARRRRGNGLIVA